MNQLIRAATGIGTGVMILIIFLVFALFLIPNLVVAFLLAFIGASVIYFPLIFPQASGIVPENKAWTISNKFKAESSERLHRFDGYRKITAQWERQAGFFWKFFWEKPSKVVDMARQITIENDRKEPYTLKDGKQIRLKWRIFTVPLPGDIVNHVRTDPADIQRRVRDRVENFIQSYIGDTEKIGFGAKQMADLKAAFVQIYGGPWDIDKEEREMGIWTGIPEIVDIDAPEEVQAAKNLEEEMQSVSNIASKLVENSKGNIKFDKAMQMVLMYKNKSNFDYIELAGLFAGQQANPGKGKGKK